MHGLIPSIINVAILIGIFVYYLRKPLEQFVLDRSNNMRDDLQRVSEQLRESQVKYDEFSAKLKSIDVEIDALRDQARQEAEALRVRLVTDAKRVSVSIVADARTTGQSLITEFRNQLRSEFANRVVDRAELLLRARLTGDDRVRIRRDFSRQMEAIR